MGCLDDKLILKAIGLKNLKIGLKTFVNPIRNNLV